MSRTRRSGDKTQEVSSEDGVIRVQVMSAVYSLGLAPIAKFWVRVGVFEIGCR